MDGILDGSLQHEQSEYHCGTGHCFAGWCEVIAAEAYRKKKGFMSVPLQNEYTASFWRRILYPFLKRVMGRSFVAPPERNSYVGSWGGYAAKRWGLSGDERNLLFAGNNSKHRLNQIVKRFENGQRYV
jgi:hypothetical protein